MPVASVTALSKKRSAPCSPGPSVRPSTPKKLCLEPPPLPVSPSSQAMTCEESLAMLYDYSLELTAYWVAKGDLTTPTVEEIEKSWEELCPCSPVPVQTMEEFWAEVEANPATNPAVAGPVWEGDAAHVAAARAKLALNPPVAIPAPASDDLFSDDATWDNDALWDSVAPIKQASPARIPAAEKGKQKAASKPYPPAIIPAPASDDLFSDDATWNNDALWNSVAPIKQASPARIPTADKGKQKAASKPYPPAIIAANGPTTIVPPVAVPAPASDDLFSDDAAWDNEALWNSVAPVKQASPARIPAADKGKQKADDPYDEFEGEFDDYADLDEV